MPCELELNRVINNIQELLYSASDVSHDRCVKVLTARAKVGVLRHAAAVSCRRWRASEPNFVSLCAPQDGSLERLSSAEFVCLSQAVEAFSRDTEELCGRRSVSLRGALQSQANRFVHRFHEERKNKLRWVWLQAVPPLLGLQGSAQPDVCRVSAASSWTTSAGSRPRFPPSFRIWSTPSRTAG